MKTTVSSRAGRALIPAMMIVLSLAAVAWACTQSAYLEAANPQKGLPGTEITIDGGSFNPGIVEIRWNSPEGRLSVSATGPAFSARVTVPEDMEPGIYYLVAIQKDSRGTFLGKGSTAFEITPSSAPVISGGSTGFSAPSEARTAEAHPGSFKGRSRAAGPGEDLWSGFAARGASLGSEAASPAESQGSGPPMAAGVALLAAGLLASGAVVAAQVRARMTGAAGRR